jgi:hypothetical protein
MPEQETVGRNPLTEISQSFSSPDCFNLGELDIMTDLPLQADVTLLIFCLLFSKILNETRGLQHMDDEQSVACIVLFVPFLTRP